jgi:hypothetical protein
MFVRNASAMRRAGDDAMAHPRDAVAEAVTSPVGATLTLISSSCSGLNQRCDHDQIRTSRFRISLVAFSPRSVREDARLVVGVEGGAVLHPASVDVLRGEHAVCDLLRRTAVVAKLDRGLRNAAPNQLSDEDRDRGDEEAGGDESQSARLSSRFIRQLC